MAGTFDRSALVEFFLIEAEDHLQNLTSGLLNLEKAPQNRETLDELFRSAHTLKGSAAMMGFQVISEVAHRVEDVLGKVRVGELNADRRVVNFIFQALDAIRGLVNDIPAKRPADPAVAQSITQQYQELVSSIFRQPSAEPAAASTAAAAPTASSATAPAAPAPSQAPAAEKPEPAREAPVPTSASLRESIEAARRTAVSLDRGRLDVSEIEKQVIRVHIQQLNNMMNLVGELVVRRNHMARQLHFIQEMREQLQFSQSRLLKVVRGFEEKYEFSLPVVPGPAASRDELTSEFFDLEFDKYDDVNLLSRQLTEITNDINEIMAEFSNFFDRFGEETSQISLITSQLQDEITQARMVEIDKLFMRFARPVRDLAQQERKQVELLVSGGETRIDKTVFETISDPLMHMVRNAVSHGIELPEERKARGKPPTGSIILKARHEGNSIVIEIEDDGRGIDPDVIRTEAVRKGFLTATAAKELTDEEAINLIFLPGFTTRREVSSLSGRGVGMDVVNTDIAKVNGRIEVETAKGVGTKFTVKLPLTLAISQALIVRAGEHEFAIPLSAVEETTRFTPREIQHVAGEDVVNLRGKFLPVYKLPDILGLHGHTFERHLKYPTLILRLLEKQTALMVEEIVGREEIVVKNLGPFFKDFPLFSGATVSGEGTVRLILDTMALVGERASAQPVAARVLPPAEEAAAAAEAPPRPAEAAAPRVLVVADSISIRKYMGHVLQRAGFQVEVAIHGMEALEKLAEKPFDLIITDLEMPVMHGYELLAELKRSPRLSHIPVAVLTSRAGEKHRQKAAEMGAQDYLVKPFDEEAIIALAQRLTGKRVTA